VQVLRHDFNLSNLREMVARFLGQSPYSIRMRAAKGSQGSGACTKRRGMKKNEPIAQVMTSDVVVAHVGLKVSDVRKLITEGDFHHVPVVSGKKLLGMITASDILGITVEGVDSDQRSMDAYIDHQFSVEGLMRKELSTLRPNSTVADAAELLSDGNFHAAPVVDDAGDLVGLVTSTDLIRFLKDLF
jgi:CBS domain-containing protein